MTTAEILLFIALTWIVTASVIALVFCLRLKRDNERAQLQCKFDPMATKGIEKGDGLYRVTYKLQKGTRR